MIAAIFQGVLEALGLAVAEAAHNATRGRPLWQRVVIVLAVIAMVVVAAASLTLLATFALGMLQAL